MQSMTKIIAVLNDFTMIDAVLDKTLTFSQKHHATVEILYVHERPLFEIPDFFRSGEQETPLDKEKIKVSIKLYFPYLTFFMCDNFSADAQLGIS